MSLELSVLNRTFHPGRAYFTGSEPEVVMDSEYEKLADHSKSMKKLTKKIKSNLKKHKSFWFGFYWGAKEIFFKHVLGKEPFSIYQLLDMHLSALKSLNNNLHAVTSKSRSELLRHEHYRDEICSEFNRTLEKRKQLEKTKGKNRSEYKQQIKKLSSTKRDSSVYFSVESKVKELYRDFFRAEHDCNLSNDAINSLGSEKERLLYQEDYLRHNLHVLERRMQASKRIARHIENTKDMYPLLEEQGQALAAVEETVVLLGEYINGIDQEIIQGKELQSGQDPAGSLPVADIRGSLEKLEHREYESCSRSKKSVDDYLR